MKSRRLLPVYWGLLNGVNSLIGGYLLINYALTSTNPQTLLLLCIYALLAYGGQVPIGIWIEKHKAVRPVALISIFILTFAVQLAFIHLPSAIFLAGLASGGIHVAGSAMCMQSRNNKTGLIGFFMLAGLTGLVFGGYAGLVSHYWLYVPLLLVFSISTLILKDGFPAYRLKKSHGSVALGPLAIIVHMNRRNVSKERAK